MAIKSNLDPIFLPVVLSNFDKLNSNHLQMRNKETI